MWGTFSDAIDCSQCMKLLKRKNLDSPRSSWRFGNGCVFMRANRVTGVSVLPLIFDPIMKALGRNMGV